MEKSMKIVIAAALITLLVGALGISRENFNIILAISALAVFVWRAVVCWRRGDEKKGLLWLVCAGMVLLSFFDLRSIFTISDQKLIRHVLNAPDAGIAAAWEAEARSDAELKAAISELFEGDASEELIDVCMDMGDVLLYHVNALEKGYQIRPGKIKVERVGKEDVYTYEAVLEATRENAETLEISVQGRVAYDSLANMMGHRKIDVFTIEGSGAELP